MNVRDVNDSAIIGWGPEVALLNFPLMAVREDVVDFNLAPAFYEKLLNAGLALAGSQGARAVLMGNQTWVVTCDPDRLAAWKPACGCEPCDVAKLEGVALLASEPGSFMGYCDMTYVIIHR